jgi:hypothetical protein
VNTRIAEQFERNTPETRTGLWIVGEFDAALINLKTS